MVGQLNIPWYTRIISQLLQVVAIVHHPSTAKLLVHTRMAWLQWWPGAAIVVQGLEYMAA